MALFNINDRSVVIAFKAGTPGCDLLTLLH